MPKGKSNRPLTLDCDLCERPVAIFIEFPDKIRNADLGPFLCFDCYCKLRDMFFRDWNEGKSGGQKAPDFDNNIQAQVKEILKNKSK